MKQLATYDDIIKRILDNPKQLQSIDEFRFEIWDKTEEIRELVFLIIHKNPKYSGLKMNDYDTMILAETNLIYEPMGGKVLQYYAYELIPKLKKQYNQKITSNLHWHW